MKLQDKARLLPIRRGLINGKHRQKMGNAVWLFEFFISIVSWKNWEGNTSYKAIQKQLGVSRKTVYRWFQILKNNDYISYKRGRYSFYFKIHKPKSQKVTKQYNEFVKTFGQMGQE